MRGRWRLFRHEAGRAAGPPPWAYVVLFAVSQLIGLWSLSAHGVVTIWLANGVLAAALLQLHRRPAIMVAAACLALNLAFNLIRAESGGFTWINPLLNLGTAATAAVLARRVCGAALDMRRPARLIRFAILAAAPAVMLSALIAVGGLGVIGRPSSSAWLFSLKTYVTVELLDLLLVTPTLLLLARAHRFRDTARRSRVEAAALLGLVLVVAAGVCWQDRAPLIFLIFPPLVLIALRLSPPWAAGALIATTAVSAFATLAGHGPVHLTQLAPDPALDEMAPLIRRMGVYNLFILALVVTVLPISTVMTERRRLEARLRARTLAAQEARRRAEDAAAARSRFLAMMSHEMRTPLNGVAGFADLLASRPDLDPEAVRHARQIRQSSDGLLMLVEDILDFARGDDSVLPAAVDIAAVAREAADAARGAAEARGLTLVVDDHLPPGARYAADPQVLRRALNPLVGNAVKFTEVGEVRVRLDRAADGVAIQISDTGCGIPSDVLPHLFEAFAQGDASISRAHCGVGLGLALAARYVRRLGGHIEVDSRPGDGSVFTVHLPLARLADAAASEPAPERPGEPIDASATSGCERAPRVLVVDDHPVNREVARIMLCAFGCQVEEACDGDEAIERVQSESFDLVLMDVRMPRLDGLEATRRIRDLPGGEGDLAIVAMTADAMPEDVERCLAAGMNAHLPKPVSQTGLFDAVARALSGELPPARLPQAA